MNVVYQRHNYFSSNIPLLFFNFLTNPFVTNKWLGNYKKRVSIGMHPKTFVTSVLTDPLAGDMLISSLRVGHERTGDYITRGFKVGFPSGLLLLILKIFSIKLDEP